MKKVAVTGGLSCGKSSVCQFFKKYGAVVASADDIVHRLLSPNTTLGQEVIQLIGSDILVDNQINRSKIAEKVFQKPTLLQALEKILHPAVLKEIKELYHQAKDSKELLFVAEIPLLFEAGGEDFYDAVVTVVSDPVIAKKRFNKKTGFDDKEFDKRLQRQMPLEQKAKKADYVIVNNGTLKELESKTKELIKILTK